jgi:hypothetical protein
MNTETTELSTKPENKQYILMQDWGDISEAKFSLEENVPGQVVKHVEKTTRISGAHVDTEGYEIKKYSKIVTENDLKSLRHKIKYTYSEKDNIKELKSPIKTEANLEEFVDSFNRRESFGINFIATMGIYGFLEILKKYDLVESSNNSNRFSLQDMSNVIKDGLFLIYDYSQNQTGTRTYVTDDLMLYKLEPRTRKKITLKQLLGEDN